MAIETLEPQFYTDLLQGLELGEAGLPHQMELPKWGELAKAFQDKFVNKNESEWLKISSKLDACVIPVLTFAEATEHMDKKDPPPPSKLLYTMIEIISFSQPPPH